MKKLSYLFILSCIVIAAYACKKETDTDRALYDETIQSGYVYYQNAALLPGLGNSPHGSFKLRFNAIAAAALDSTGELPVGSTFPDGSIIVKDVYSGSNITLYAVMKKDASNSDAGDGWLWAEFEPNGKTIISTSKKGNSCIGCHSGNTNRDLTNTFDLH